MSVLGFLILYCFIVLMLSGTCVLIYSLLRLMLRDSPLQLSLLGIKMKLKRASLSDIRAYAVDFDEMIFTHLAVNS